MRMKKILLIAFVVSTQIGNAQTADSKYAVGLNFIKNEYNGDYGNGVFDFNKPGHFGLGLFMSRYLSPSFDMGIQFSSGSYGYFEDTDNNFVGGKFDLSLFTHYKLNNGYMLKADSKLSPFVSLGFGFANYFTTNSATPFPTIVTNGADFVLPLGAGFKFQLTNSIAIQYQYLYNLTNSDVHDQNRSGGVINTVFGTSAHPLFKAGNDAFGQHAISFVINFDRPKDADRDGVTDIYDECANTPRNVKVDEDGCPVDEDSDGVPDYLDKCYNTPARVKVDTNGCPLDTDKDGIPDYLDK